MILENDQISLLLEASAKGMHRTLRGKYVKIGSPACKADLESRIDDITHNRNSSGSGSDARSYYSGVLRVLRRKMRENDKIMASQQLEKDAKKGKKLSESIIFDEEKIASKMLRMAGIF